MPFAPLSGATEESGVGSATVGNLVWASVLFNFVLCFIDTDIMTLSPIHVIAAEAAILGTALLLPLTRSQRTPGRLDVLLIFLFASWLLLSMLRQSVDPKFFRDVAIIPIFVLLGLVSRGEMLHQRIFWLHMTILVFAIWEAVSPTSFVSVFAVADFFNHTRGTTNEDWWIDSGLYLSAVRPEARFLFPDLPVHRLSSVFLEPVSLGNYVVISTIWLAGFWEKIPRRMRIGGVVTTILLLVGSDSRMATVTCLAILLARPFRHHLPSLAPLLTAPLVIIGMFLAVSLLGLETGLDNFEGRIAHAVEVFREFKLTHYSGLSLDLLREAQDAGFAYVIMTQSLIGAVAIWCCLFFRRLATPQARYVHLAVALYVALNLTVSWSLFSIKTAALLWLLLGRSVRDDRDRIADETTYPEGAAANRNSEPVFQQSGALSNST